MRFLDWLSRTRETISDWLLSARQAVRARWLRFRYWLSTINFAPVINLGKVVGVYAAYVFGYGTALTFVASTYTDLPFNISYIVANGSVFYFIKEELRELIVKIMRKEVE